MFYNRLLSSFLFVLLVVSCNDDSVQISTSNTKGSDKGTPSTGVTNVKPELFPGQRTKDRLMTVIDSNKTLIAFSSLKYINNQNLTIGALGLMDKNRKIRKMTLEQALTSEVNLSAKTTFYYDSTGALRISRHLAIDNRNKKNSVSEITSYYEGAPGNITVFASFEKTANTTDSLDDVVAQQIELKAFSDETVMRVVNQLGPFETRFLGKAKNGELNFIIVGTNGPTGHRSTLAYDESNNSVKTFLQNEKKYFNRKVRVTFGKGIDGNGMEIQTLQSIE